MKDLNKEEMLEISGGGDISNTVINTYLKSITSIYEMGRSFGSSLRRLFSGKVCKI